MITDTGINSSGNARRGIKQDERGRKLLTERERKRKVIEEANEFADTLKRICPGYFD